ncbi:flagellar motor protein PomA [Terasakiispira papahanaumokuakeensis]|uniref:Flagellar motor protein PomA n=1 Tax=Terasakiispira papahanaumokuakeensis TaxID=197479 RepID=A0A1E2V8V1_9GAMM|nr:MotA/TolQ/ExbB proton channel family protein [Terasakiispira papahanaumokuakeensis]ODC03404.1 flagellar motor protein PomA [Terasakiispira papahanaumokuakeensis]
MDLATLLGLVIGTVLIALSIVTSSNVDIYLNLPGLLLVVGGTGASALIKFRIQSFFVGLKEGFATAFFDRNDNPREIIGLANRLSRIARRNGLLGLEDEPIPNPFFAKGVQMCVDGSAPEFIQEVLTKEMYLSIYRKQVGEKVFRAMGDSAPAFGMIGTLVGLVAMLNNLDDPSKLGPGMAIALLTTFYGALMAQLFFLPMAEKLAMKTEELENNMSLIIDSVMGIYNGMNPQVLDELLETYLPEYQRGGITMTEEID